MLEVYGTPWTTLMIDNSYYRTNLWAGHNSRGNYLFADSHVESLRPLQTVKGGNKWYRDGSELPTVGMEALQLAEDTFRN